MNYKMSELEKRNTVKSRGQVSGNVTFEGTQDGSPRIMFLGNSITRHGVRAEIGWLNNWGMAASAKENDYVHRIISFVQESHPDAASCIVQGSNFFFNADKDKGIKLCSERSGTTYVDIFDISRNEENLAIGLFKHKGVQIHPGDNGLKK